MEKMKNISIKKAIIIYISISLVVSFLLGALMMSQAEKVQKKMWWNYRDEEVYFEVIEQEKNGYAVTIPRPSQTEMSEIDCFISEACDFMQTYSILMTSIVGIVIVVVLFYRNKIQRPLEEMTAATQMVANNNLDFKVMYQSKDELGQLCMEFERMRAELEKNHREMWRMLEEEKELRAAIVHDIRTPLATLRGYQEMLLDFVPAGMLSTSQAADMLNEGMVQIDRIHDFVEGMRKLSGLEQRELELEKTNVELLENQIEKNVRAVEKEYGKLLHIQGDSSDDEIHVDIKLILEVTENIVSNALRFAKQTVNIIVSKQTDMIIIEVQDDGIGFKEDSEKVTKAYYHSNDEDDLKHLGMGLYISRIYCEKHGGKLIINNLPFGGASVKAIFKTNI